MSTIPTADQQAIYVSRDPAGLWVVTATYDSRRPRTLAGPFQDAARAWHVAESKAHQLGDDPIYTVNPDWTQAIDEDYPKSSAAWLVTTRIPETQQ